MKQYHELLKAALSGERRQDDRTGAGTVGVFQREARFDLTEGFPIVTTKPVYWKGVVEELLWFLRGETNIRSLLEKKVGIWTSDALRFNLDKVLRSGLITKSEVEQAQREAKNKNYHPAEDLLKRFERKILEDEDFASHAGELGPVYGAQWRGKSKTQPVDQLAMVEEALSKKKYNRRLIVSAWNLQDVSSMALPPCHYVWQVNVSPESQRLTLGWSQRSCDTMLGVPFNIASYGLLANLLAHTHGYDLGELVGKFEDLHVYLPHVPAAEEQLKREPKSLPRLEILAKKSSVAEYSSEDINLVGYEKHPKLENPTPMFGGFF
jgi:thymidylate synthase